MEIYIEKDGQVTGPYRLNEIQARLEDAYFDGTELACHEGLDEWVAVKEVVGDGREGEGEIVATTDDDKSSADLFDIVCPECKKTYASSEAACPRCNTTLVEASEKPPVLKVSEKPPENKQVSRSPLILLFGAIICAVIVVGAIWVGIETSEGWSETSKSMPNIKGFHLGMSSDEANKILDNLLDKHLQEELDLKFTDNKLVSITFPLGSKSSAKIFNDGGISIPRFVEEFGEAYDLPPTFTIPEYSSRAEVISTSIEKTTYSYENRGVGYSIKIEAHDWINPNGSSLGVVLGLDFKLIYSKIKPSSGLKLGN